jgi:WD40 repeat protein
VWNMQTGERLITLDGYSMGGAARGGASSDWINITALAFAPDGKTLAAGTGGYVTSGGWVELWDMADQTIRDRLPGGGTMEGLAYSPDGTLLATSSVTSGVRLWDVATGEVLKELGPIPGTVERVAFSPDGTQLAVDMTWKLSVWDVATGESRVAVETGEAGADYAFGVAYSPDGRLLATGGPNSTIALWDPATGTLLGTLAGHESSIYDIVFSPVPLAGDLGRWLMASATRWDQGPARLWAVQREGDTVSATELAVLEGGISRVAFSPDGALLATGNETGVAQLWDTATTDLLAEFRGHAESIASLAFSSDGTLVATGGWDGTIRLWGILAGGMR